MKRFDEDFDSFIISPRSSFPFVFSHNKSKKYCNVSSDLIGRPHSLFQENFYLVFTSEKASSEIFIQTLFLFYRGH